MSYTMEDFKRDYTKKHFAKLTVEEQVAVWRSLPARTRAAIFQSLPVAEQEQLMQALPMQIQAELLQALRPKQKAELLRSLPPEELLAVLSTEQIRAYLNDRTAARPQQPRKPLRKKK